jgi:iron complex outermembrane receptor protein
MKPYRALFATTSLCSGLMLAALAGPGWAADQGTPPGGGTPPPAQPGPGASPPSTPTNAAVSSSATSGTAVSELVVTGSRIKTTTYSSPAPIEVITAERAELTGAVDTAQILQLNPVAANAVQINNYFTGFVTTGGPGANTLSLRGLGSDRTLFLLNGQRLGPAGVGGTVGPFDLNVIPESIIDHIDILKDGASSIYGSDAVAGVVNIVTKTNQDGGDIHATFEPSDQGGGNQYRADASYGKTFDKGYVSAAFDYYRQDPLRLNQRGYLNCSRDLVKDSAGKIADVIDPRTGQSKCWNEIANAVEDLDAPFFFPGAGVVYAANAGTLAGTGPFGSNLAGWQNVGLTIPGNPAATRLSHGLEPESSALFNENTAISPDSRYTFTLFGGYDLTPHAQLYASVLLNQRDSEQDLFDQFFVEPVNPGNPFNKAGFGFPVPIIQQGAPATQTVDYGRFVLGVKGDLPDFHTLRNWTYDLYGQFSRSDGSYTQVYQKTDRVNATAGAGAGTNGCDVNATIGDIFGSPTGETMAQAEPGVACVPVDYFRAAAVGHFTPAEMAFLYTNARGNTIYDQGYVEGSITGDLFQLPAGPLAGAFGFHVRHESIDDTPPPDFINSNVYNFSTSGITKGSQNITEGFGEFKIPVVKDLPAIYSLDIDLSGRYSNYEHVGGTFTYKGTVDWKLTDWIAARGTYGTAFRAPALFELFLADQTGFFDQVEIDPCVQYGTSGVSPVIQKNCASLGIPPNYVPTGSSAEILTGGGAGHLKPETSIAETLGFVLTPKIWNQQINFSVDYYSFVIDNQIQQFGAANIIDQCYGSLNFPADPFCSLIHREGAGTATPFTIDTVQNDYVNVAKELDQGIDLDLNYRTQLPWQVKLTVDAELDWTTYTNTFLLGGSTNNFLGTIGYPRFVGNVDWKFDRGPWTFNWELYMIGHASDNPATATSMPSYRGTGEAVTMDYVTPFYTLSNVSIRRKFDKFTAIVGVKNLFDQAPPAISFADSFEPHTIGTTPSAVSQYDLIGRAFYIDLDAKF